MKKGILIVSMWLGLSVSSVAFAGSDVSTGFQGSELEKLVSALVFAASDGDLQSLKEFVVCGRSMPEEVPARVIMSYSVALREMAFIKCIATDMARESARALQPNGNKGITSLDDEDPKLVAGLRAALQYQAYVMNSYFLGAIERLHHGRLELSDVLAINEVVDRDSKLISMGAMQARASTGQLVEISAFSSKEDLQSLPAVASAGGRSLIQEIRDRHELFIDSTTTFEKDVYRVSGLGDAPIQEEVSFFDKVIEELSFDDEDSNIEISDYMGIPITDLLSDSEAMVQALSSGECGFEEQGLCLRVLP